MAFMCTPTLNGSSRLGENTGPDRSVHAPRVLGQGTSVFSNIFQEYLSVLDNFRIMTHAILHSELVAGL